MYNVQLACHLDVFPFLSITFLYICELDCRFFPLLSLAGAAAAAAASAATVSRYIFSTQIIASFSSDGIVMTPSGLGIFKVL